jgi:TetR/AcrR family transcriptional regulator
MSASRSKPRPSRRPPGRPSAAKRPEVRDALLDAASRLFGRRGSAGVSLRQVASEAGVTPAMVNYYFGGKQGLHDAMLERTLARILERARAVIERQRESAASAGDQLAALLAVLVDNFRAEPWVPALVVREVLAEGGRLRERFIRDYAQHMAALLPGLMQREIDAGRFRRDLDPRLAFLSFMGMTVMPFVARPVVERVLGIDYDEDFLRRFAAHTHRLFLEGAEA